MAESTAVQRSDRLQTNVARVIVVVSIFGAVVSWRASEASEQAGSLDQQTAQDNIVVEQARAMSRSAVAQDLRLLGPAQQAYVAGVLLDQDAREARRTGGLALAEELRAEARGRRREGDTLSRYLTAGSAFEFKGRGGALSYDRDGAIRFNDSNNPDLSNLRPAETRRLGDEAHDKSVNLVLAATTLVMALFFLTLSQLGGSLRRGFAGVGIAVTLLGALLFVIA